MEKTKHIVRAVIEVEAYGYDAENAISNVALMVARPGHKLVSLTCENIEKAVSNYRVEGECVLFTLEKAKIVGVPQ